MFYSSLLALSLVAATPRFIADLNSTPATPYTGARVFATVGDKAYFSLGTSAGVELWVTDLSSGTTRMVKDIHPGGTSSTPFFVGVLGERVFFLADDGVHGSELWSTDGTREETRLLKDIRPGPGNTGYRGWILWNSTFYFLANDGVHGIELWRSDGTPEGTQLVSDAIPGPNGFSDESTRLLEFEGALYFSSYNQLWRTDGTAAGTRLVYAVDESTHTRRLSPSIHGGKLWFSSGYSSLYIWNLYVTDGTPEGTQMVSTIAPSTGPNRDVGGMYVFGVWSGSNGVYDIVLRATDGTRGGTKTIATIRSNDTRLMSSWPDPNGSQALFAVSTSSGISLWRTDGTSTGTSSFHSLQRLLNDPSRIGSQFVYVGVDQTGPAVFVWDGVAAPRAVRRFAGLPATNMALQNGGRLYFVASDALTGLEPWTTDGTEEGTVLLGDLSPGSDGTNFTKLSAGGPQVLLSGTPAGGAPSVWRTHGTPEATSRVFEGRLDDVAWSGTTLGVFSTEGTGCLLRVLPEGGSEGLVTRFWSEPNTGAFPTNWTSGGTFAYVTATQSLGRDSLLRTDGTRDGTQVIHTAGWLYSRFTQLERLGSSLTFREDDVLRISKGEPSDVVSLGTAFGKAHLGARVILGRGGASRFELAESNGTQAGTVSMQSVVGRPFDFVAAGGPYVFFRQYVESAQDYLLYRTDGTRAAGAVIRLATVPADKLVAYENRVAFVTQSASLWTSDGTVAGTALVPGMQDTAPMDLFAVGPLLFFTAEDAASGREVWVLRGTQALRLGDFEPGAGDTRLLAATRQGTGVVLLIQSYSGRYLVRTNGSPEGTTVVGAVSGTTWLTTHQDTVFLDCELGSAGLELCRLDPGASQPTLVADLWPGEMPSAPSAPIRVSGTMVLSAVHPEFGMEPFAVDDVDVTPPVVKANVTGVLGSNGIYVGDVSLSWSIEDAESSVIQTKGCDAETVTTDTLEQVFTCTATSSGGTTLERVLVRRDSSRPTLTCPVGLDGIEGTAVLFDVSVSDALDPAPKVEVVPPSGSVFPVGTSTVDVRATDHAGHQATCRFSVTITARPAPDAGPGDAGPGDAGPGDSGPGDAGPGDAGPGEEGRGDGGVVDGGVVIPGPGESGSCGCAGGGGSLFFALLVLVLPTLVRRRR